MKKRTLMLSALAVAAATASVSLTSCSGGQDPAHTITFYHTMGDALQKVLDTAIEDYEAKFPGWKIQASQVGGYDDVRKAVIADLTAGQQPDLAYCYADHVALYLESEKVVDMSKFFTNDTKLTANVKEEGSEEYVAKEFDETIGYSEAERKDFVQGYLKEGYATNYADYAQYGFTEKSLLTIPYVKSTEVLYYNADALKACKLEVPETWDDLWKACETIKKKYPNSTPLGYDSEANWVITMCEQNGWGYTQAQTPHYLFKNDGLTGWLEDLAEKYDKELFTTQNNYGSYTSNLFVKGAEEGSVFSIGSSGGASHQASDKFKWGVAQIPGTKESDGTINKSVISQGPSLVMLHSSSDNADEKEVMTWEFVKMLETPEFQCSFAMASGYNPTRESSFEVSEYKKFLEGDSIVAKTALVGKEQTPYYYTSPAFKGSSTARDQMGTAFVYAVSGQKTAAKALEDALNKCGA